uniref:Uncharacterized protein n=1 Tax=Lepeophtheirus salmonis TaxID=72036 RepID=A0A0K2V460_LEPSM
MPTTRCRGSPYCHGSRPPTQRATMCGPKIVHPHTHRSNARSSAPTTWLIFSPRTYGHHLRRIGTPWTLLYGSLWRGRLIGHLTRTWIP